MPARPVTVLVVEDEFLIRMDVVDQLQAEGFRTLEAGTGQEALEILQQGKQVDVVFTDVDMPGNVNGVVLAHTVEEKWPAAGIIVTSGQAIIADDALPAGASFLPKPYRVAIIVAAIRKLLG